MKFRWTLATSLKYCMAGNAPVEELSPHMESFLKMMHNDDLDVKKAALLMVNAAVHHQVCMCPHTHAQQSSAERNA